MRLRVCVKYISRLLWYTRNCTREVYARARSFPTRCCSGAQGGLIIIYYTTAAAAAAATTTWESGTHIGCGISTGRRGGGGFALPVAMPPIRAAHIYIYLYMRPGRFPVAQCFRVVAYTRSSKPLFYNFFFFLSFFSFWWFYFPLVGGLRSRRGRMYKETRGRGEETKFFGAFIVRNSDLEHCKWSWPREHVCGIHESSTLFVRSFRTLLVRERNDEIPDARRVSDLCETNRIRRDKNTK